MVSGKMLVLGAVLACTAAPAVAAQRWLAAADRNLSTDGAVQSVSLPHPDSGPTTVVVAADGQVWFTESSGNRIGRMNPDGTGLVEYPLPHPDSGPRILARGADGNLWFSEHTGNRIGRITPAGVITEFDIPTPASHPRAIALGGDGAIWFGEFDGGKIGRITVDGRISEFAVPTPGSGPRALATGADGNIWFSEYRASKIGRITPAGVITEFTLPRPNSGPGDITAGADGALWFVELSGGADGLTTDGNRVGRIDLAGTVTEYPMPSRTPSAVNLAVGPDRNVWYTQGGRLGRVTPEGRINEYAEYALGASARGVGISAGSDREPPTRLVNRLYVADGGNNRIAWLEFAAPVARAAGTALPAVAPVMPCEAFVKPGTPTAFTLEDGSPVRIETALHSQRDGQEICTLKGYVAPQVRFELRLPVGGWHQRLLFTGCGGFCGQVALNAQASEHCAPVDNGEMALVSSDLGHVAAGPDTLWAAGNAQALRDYGHRAVHVVTQAAKVLVGRYYGQAARYSYFTGCSDGGREGVVAAMRYPHDFDGIVAGAPVVDDAVNNSLYHAWLVRHLSRRDGSAVFSDADLHRLYDAQLKACPVTGSAPAVIADPRRCQLDLATVGLTPEQVAAAQALYAGPLDERGKPLYFGAPPGSELTWSTWAPLSKAFVDSFVSYAVNDPPLATFDVWKLDFTQASRRSLARVGAVINGVDPDLAAFHQAGGKLLLWHGWGDAGVPAMSTVRLYEGLRKRLGRDAAAAMLRLYMLPGAYHCGNGPGADRIDLLTPLMDWVERGVAPGAVTAAPRSGGPPAVIQPEG